MRWLMAMVVLVASAWGQAGTTLVTAQVKDTNGALYVNCSWSAVFVGQNTTPGAGPYAPAAYTVGQQGHCDSSANLSVNLGDNVNTITPTPSQWSFAICSGQGYLAGPYCKVNILITITGATQDISAALTAALPLLPMVAGTGTVSSIGTALPITGGPFTVSGTIACPTCVTSTGMVLNHIASATGVQSVGTVANPYLADSATNTQSAILQGYANGPGGTTNQLIVKLNGTDNTVVTVGTSDTEALGIMDQQGGSSGNGEVALLGNALCTFDNTTVAGHYVQISTTSAGKCHDSGAAVPVCGSVIIGRAVEGGAAGSHRVAIALTPPTCVGGGGVSAQVGDTLRWNVNGDNAWDAVNYAQSVVSIYAQNQSSNLQEFGQFGSGAATVTGSQSTVNPTATAQSGNLVSAAATASLNTVIGAHYPENGNVSLMGMEAFNRWTFKGAMGVTTNVRYWFGLGCWNNTGTANNNVAIVGTTAYAADVPNKSTIGFRYSAGVDTNWQAVAATAGGSQTTVDTGIAPDTGIHVWEMATNAAGTSIFYLIDGTVRATISTNLPPPANGGNSWGELFFTGDNKNTNNAISLTFYSMQASLK